MKTLTFRTTNFLSDRRQRAAQNVRSRQSGQAMLEVALVLPILLILALGVIEIGRYAYIVILVGNAARAGADYGAQSHLQSIDTTGIQNAAYYDFAGTTSSSTIKTNGQLYSNLTVTSAVSCGCDSGGTITSYGCTTATYANAGTCATGNWVVVVSVTASGTFNSLFRYPGIPATLSVSKTASIPVA